MTMLEIFGYLSTAVVIVSFLVKDIIKLRVINTIGCIMFAIYGYMHGAMPIVYTNLAVISINVYHLIKSKTKH